MLEYYIEVISDISSMLLFVTASLTVNSDVYYHSVYCNVYSDNIMYERFCQTSLCLRSMRIFIRHGMSKIFDMVCPKYSTWCVQNIRHGVSKLFDDTRRRNNWTTRVVEIIGQRASSKKLDNTRRRKLSI